MNLLNKAEYFVQDITIADALFWDFMACLSPVDHQESDAILPGQLVTRLQDSVGNSAYVKAAIARTESGNVLPMCLFGCMHVYNEVWAPWYVQTKYADGSYVFAKRLVLFSSMYLAAMLGTATAIHWREGRPGRPVLENYIWEESDTALAYCERLGFEVSDYGVAGTEGNVFKKVRFTI